MADLNEQLQGLQNQLNGHFNDKQSSDTRKTETVNPSEAPDGGKISEEEDQISDASLSTSECSGESSEFYFIDSNALDEPAGFVVIPHATVV